jgi:hypothetical protein
MQAQTKTEPKHYCCEVLKKKGIVILQKTQFAIVLQGIIDCKLAPQ